jgi:hypothetical protein
MATTDDLTSLIERAKNASPADRIGYREYRRTWRGRDRAPGALA